MRGRIASRQLRVGAALVLSAAGGGRQILGGWQVSSFFTFQSGAPFTVLNGSDPTGALAGIDGLVGNAIRPMLNTTRDISGMSIPELLAAGGASLFRPLCGNPSPTCAESA